jgi:hypothetical protein
MNLGLFIIVSARSIVLAIFISTATSLAMVICTPVAAFENIILYHGRRNSL